MSNTGGVSKDAKMLLQFTSKRQRQQKSVYSELLWLQHLIFFSNIVTNDSVS